VFDYWLVERPAQQALQAATTVKKLTESAAVVAPSATDALGAGSIVGAGAARRAAGGVPDRVPADAFRPAAAAVTVRNGASTTRTPVSTTAVPPR